MPIPTGLPACAVMTLNAILKVANPRRARSLIAKTVLDTVLLNRPGAFGIHGGQARYRPSHVEHHWSVYIWWHVARVVFSWSTRAVSRLRR